MRVVLVSKALVVGAYQRKAEELAALGIELTVLIPPGWGDRRGQQHAERTHTIGYDLRVIPLRFNGNFHLHYYPTLPHVLAALRPDILHMDEEPYNFATFLALRTATQLGVRPTFFTWQNLYRRYPLPFAAFERANYAAAPAAIAGSSDAAAVLRRKGYRGAVSVIPQFGVDPGLFVPRPEFNAGSSTGDGNVSGLPLGTLRIGYAGGLLREKGVDLLLRACARLTVPWHLFLAGEGEEQPTLTALAEQLGVTPHITLLGRQASAAMPAFYHGLDVFVLPSRTLPNWKEQFGRVLIEAMACAVPVVGSDSGEIPHVIGDGGLIFPEDDVEALHACLQQLALDPAAREGLGAAGRARVLANFTMRAVAVQTVDLYHNLLARQKAAR